MFNKKTEEKKRAASTVGASTFDYDAMRDRANDLEREGRWGEAAEAWTQIVKQSNNRMVIKMAERRVTAAQLNARENDDTQATHHVVAGHDGELITVVVPGREPAPPAEKEVREGGPILMAVRDARLPELGAVIQKVDRHGRVRCECKVVEGGIEYKGQVYKSISGAGLAAAKDLGLKSTTNDGWTFWGLQKRSSTSNQSARKSAVETIERAFATYYERVGIAAKRATGEERARLLTTLQNQGAVLAAMIPPAAPTQE